MNRLLTAKTYVIGAHRLIEQHGLGHKKLVVQSVQNARHILKQCPQAAWHQVDAMNWELLCALDYVHDGNSREALKSLSFVEGLLNQVLDSDSSKSVVDRLLKSVFPWRGL